MTVGNLTSIDMLWVPWNPLSVGWSAFYDPATATRSGSDVTAWPATVGAVNLNPLASDTRPIYNATGKNGRPTITIGSGDNLVSAVQTGLLGANAWTIMVAFQPGSNVFQIEGYSGGYGSGQRVFGIQKYSTTQLRCHARDTSLLTNNHTVVNGAWLLVEMRLESGLFYSSVNGADEKSQAFGTTYATGPNIQIGIDYSTGVHGHIAIAPTALSADIRSKMRNWLNTYYAIY